jgi:hypothetical protein
MAQIVRNNASLRGKLVRVVDTGTCIEIEVTGMATRPAMEQEAPT